MKKICFLIGNLNHSGGTERVTTLIANALAEKKYQVSILSLADGSSPFFKVEPNIAIYSLYPKKISMKANYFGAVWRIRKFVIEHNIDTLIVVDSISCIFTIPALYGLKINHICWEHFNFKNNNGVWLRELSRKFAVLFCDYVVTLTERDKEFWIKSLKYLKAKIITIPNPTPFSQIESIPKQSNKVVLAVGRLVSVKGYDELLNIWSLVQKKEKGWTLRIVGDGEELVELKKLAQKLEVSNSVEFIAATSEISNFYKEASIFCLTSKFEGFPMVLLEAQSFGLPIVAFDCDTGPSEIVYKEYLIENRDHSAFSEKLFEIMNMKTEDYSLLCQKSKLNNKKFSVENITSYWEKILNV